MSEPYVEADSDQSDVRVWLRVTVVGAVIGVALGVVGVLLPTDAQCDPSHLATTLVKGSMYVLVCCCGSGIAGVIAARGARIWFGLLAIGSPAVFLLLIAWHLSSLPGTAACSWLS